jgi:hypothetical protein
MLGVVGTNWLESQQKKFYIIGPRLLHIFRFELNLNLNFRVKIKFDKRPWTGFTTLHSLCNLGMGPIN